MSNPIRLGGGHCCACSGVCHHIGPLVLCAEHQRPSPRTVVVPSPSAPPDPDPLVNEIADMLWRIETNYVREGSGPGSRFEGERLEVVQARAVIRHVRQQSGDPQ